MSVRLKRPWSLLISGAAAALIIGGVLTAPTAATSSNLSPADPRAAARDVSNSGSAAEVFVGGPSSRLGMQTGSTGAKKHPQWGAVAGSVAITVNPYNCWAHTERVHKSNSLASLHSRNYNCTKTPKLSVVGTEIMKKGWFGQWHRIVYMQKEKKAKTLDVNAKRYCSDNGFQTYRGNGYHRVEIGTKSYVARTSSDKETRFGCNAHGA